MLTQTILFLVSDLFTFINMEFLAAQNTTDAPIVLLSLFFFKQCIYFGKENLHTLKTSLFSCILTPKVNVLRYNFL